MSKGIMKTRLPATHATKRLLPLLTVLFLIVFTLPLTVHGEGYLEDEHGFERIVYSYGGFGNMKRSSLEESVKEWTRELGQRRAEIDREIDEIVQWFKTRPVESPAGDEWWREKEAWGKKTGRLFKLMAELDFRRSEVQRLEKIIDQYLGTPVFRLVELPETGPGFVSRNETSLYSVYIRELPLEIIPGSPVSFLIEAKQRFRWEGEHSCYDRQEKDFSGKNDKRLKLKFSGSSPLRIEAAGKKQFAALCEYAPTVRKTHEAQMVSSRDGPVMVTTKTQAPFELDDTVNMQVRLQLNKFQEQGNYLYHGHVTTSGTMLEEKGLDGSASIWSEGLTDNKGFCSSPSTSEDFAGCKSLTFEINGIRLVYRQVRPGEPYITSIPSYQHPRDFGTPPFVGEIKTTIALADLAGKSIGEAKEWLAARDLKASLRPGSPAPREELNGRVEKHDPPAGSEVNSGATVVLTVHSPFVAEVIEVPDLVGKPRKEAKQLLAALGLEIQLRPGYPAASPEESDTIEYQKPYAGTRVEPGTMITLKVHPQYVEIKTIPNVKGLPLSRAKDTLADAGIQGNAVILRPGSPAPSAELSGKVESQEPAAGATVGTDTRVTLRVYSNFIDQLQVPDVVGLALGTAKERLQASGFTLQLRPGPPAKSQGDSGKVAGQQPGAGTMARSGSQVTIKVFSPYVGQVNDQRQGRGDRPDEPSMPNLRCPSSMTFVNKHWLPDHYKGSAPPVGSKVPLIPEASGFNRAPDGTMSFSCSYSINGYKAHGATVVWLDSKSHPYFADSLYCQNDKSDFWMMTYYSRTNKVRAEAAYNKTPLSNEETMRTARDFVREVERFATPCKSSGDDRQNMQTGAQVRVPYVSGKPLEEAKRMLEAAGLHVRHSVTRNDPFCEDNAYTVTTQDPQAGKQVASGTTVNLGTFGRFIPPVNFPPCPSVVSGFRNDPAKSKMCRNSKQCDYQYNPNRNTGFSFNIFWESSSPQKSSMVRYCGNPERQSQYNKNTFYSRNRKVGAVVFGWNRIDQNWAQNFVQQWMRIAEPVAQPCGVP